MENGELWVHGTDNSIMRIDRNHRKLERIKTMSFDGNVGITLKQEGELVYTDFEDRSVNILKKSQTHAVIRLSGWKPRDVCATLEGDLLVSMTSDDEKTAKIVKYRNTKALKEYYHDLRGRPLFPTGDTALHVTENRNWDVCVAVSSAQVVIVLNGLGAVRFKYSDKSGKKEFRPMGIATDGQCHIMVTDYFNSRVHVLDKDGELLRHIEGHAEGYVFEFERRGYLRAGCFVPEVVLNHPELVQSLYEEFVHAGSDVVLAFTMGLLTGKQAFPFDLPAFACSRTQIAQFAREAKEAGVQYIGLCCGNASHYIRVVAEEYGRRPPASEFSPNMSEHFIFGDQAHVKEYHATTLLPNM
uniref:DNA damage-binding protein 1 n=1 Tax=Magallana gigas TaxID=29159 RepID=K1PSP5_MAGGI